MEQISAKEVEDLLAQGKSTDILDVREVSEVAFGKIPGAVNIPMRLLEFRMNELDKNKEYVIVCQSGARSSLVTQFLESHGYKAKNMVGGMMSWNGPIE